MILFQILIQYTFMQWITFIQFDVHVHFKLPVIHFAICASNLDVPHWL